VRRFTDPGYQPVAQSLQELRNRIDAIDIEIVALIAKRAVLVKDAARFKDNTHQVSAPARQAEVFAKVRSLAIQTQSPFEGLEQVVEATYRAMVAGFVAQEQNYFNKMIPETSHATPNSSSPS
jgi:isochorismate pyruvate lyase